MYPVIASRDSQKAEKMGKLCGVAIEAIAALQLNEANAAYFDNSVGWIYRKYRAKRRGTVHSQSFAQRFSFFLGIDRKFAVDFVRRRSNRISILRGKPDLAKFVLDASKPDDCVIFHGAFREAKCASTSE